MPAAPTLTSMRGLSLAGLALLLAVAAATSHLQAKRAQPAADGRASALAAETKEETLRKVVFAA